MARDLNKVMLIGRVGNNIELNRTVNNIAYLKFNLATNEIYKNEKGESIQKTQWHKIIMWGKIAEIASTILRKGSHVYLEGKLNTSIYEKGNEKISITRINATDFIALDKKSVTEETPVNEETVPLNQTEVDEVTNIPENEVTNIGEISDTNDNDALDSEEPPF